MQVIDPVARTKPQPKLPDSPFRPDWHLRDYLQPAGPDVRRSAPADPVLDARPTAATSNAPIASRDGTGLGMERIALADASRTALPDVQVLPEELFIIIR